MDQKELVRQLEAHFRKQDQAVHDHRKQVHAERQSLSDEEWWEQLVANTKGIRPEMLAIFERNKAEMIAKRFQTVSSEEGFREKQIQRRTMELLPYVSAVRADREETGDLTEDQIHIASMRKSSQEIDSGLTKLEAGRDKVADPRRREMLDLLIEDGRAHQQDSAQFQDPANLTDEKWDEHSGRLVDRMEKFSERLQEIMKRKPEELN